MDKKTNLYCKYFPTTANIKSVSVDESNLKRDKMAEYMQELLKVDKDTGKSLDDEINEQMAIVDKLNYYLKQMNDILKKLDGKEFELYREIVINGVGVSKAVEKIAEKHEKDVTTIWKLYHRTIKKDIHNLIEVMKK